MTPDEAIAELMNGNQRYVDGDLTSVEVDLEELRMKTQEKQMPFAAVLSCADSRVPVELVFDQSIGRLFVARVAGNLTTPEIFASLEYGAEVLAVKAILVLAHTNCGAVQAAILGKEPGGQITALYPHIQPAIPLPPTTPNPDAVALVNAQNQAELLRDASPLLKGLVDHGDIKIVSGIYDVETGVVKFDS
jgi:carbonic anhydrase